MSNLSHFSKDRFPTLAARRFPATVASMHREARNTMAIGSVAQRLKTDSGLAKGIEQLKARAAQRDLLPKREN